MLRKKSQLIRKERTWSFHLSLEYLGICLLLFRISDSGHTMFQQTTVRDGGSKPGRIQRSPRNARGMLRRGPGYSINGVCETYLKTR